MKPIEKRLDLQKQSDIDRSMGQPAHEIGHHVKMPHVTDTTS